MAGNTGATGLSEVERFFGHVDEVVRNGETHAVWTGRSVPAHGTLANPSKDDRYGIFTLDGRGDIQAHRWAWEYNWGQTPKRVVPVGFRLKRISSTCPKTCVTPEHWEPRPYGKRPKSKVDEIVTMMAQRGAQLTEEDVEEIRRAVTA